MDGAKLVTDTVDYSNVMVGRCSVRDKAFPKGCVNRSELRILVKVRRKQSENLCHRKGKGSLTMKISQGLVSPNQAPNWCNGKGKKVKIPLLLRYTRQRKLNF